MSQNLSQRTLCLLVNQVENKILLGMKNPTKFGGGNYNGPGGCVEDGEVIEKAAIRELYEEASLETNLESLYKVAELTFYFPIEQAKFNQTVHVYKILKWQGNLKDSNEMVWRWFALDNLPYDKMWDGDKYWLPEILTGKRLKGIFWFDNQRKVKTKKLEVVDLL